jgi:hypothetical protein
VMINSYLELNGLEIANGARTNEYIRRGLAGPYWQVGEQGDCSVLWRELACLDPASCFVSPAADPAPWYNAAIPASAKFLGVLIPDLHPWFDGLASRAVTPRASGLGGASIGPMHDDPRPLVTEGWLVAEDAAGIEYGRRWLQYVLGQACDPCNLAVARIRSHCPPDDGSDDTEGEWLVYEVGLTAGVKYTGGQSGPGGNLWGCENMMAISWTLETGIPYLYGRDVVCTEGSLNPEACSVDCLDFCHWLQDAPPAVLCTVAPPPIGTLAAVITIDAGAGLSDLTLSILADCDDPTSILASIFVPVLPAGSQLIVDSALEQITYTPAGGQPIDGTGFIELAFGQGVPWLAVGSCNPGRCVSAQLARICNSDCTSTVTIATRLRED